MRILGIDPGYGRIGIAILDGSRDKHTVCHSECFETPTEESFHERMKLVGLRVEGCIKKYNPHRMALETLFFNTNQKTAMGVAEVRGMLRFIGIKLLVPVFEYTPLQVKMAVTGYGKSGKLEVTSMLKRLLHLPQGERLDDEYDAMGVALTCLVSEAD